MFLRVNRIVVWTAMLAGTFSVFAGGPRSARSDEPRFVVPDGCVVEEVAGQPLVNYPLFACFDDRGRLYVAEGTGLNVAGPELVQKKLGRITLLEDTDRDGRFDKSTVFADELIFPQGVLWHDGAVYTASHPNIWKLQDTDGDDRADRREVLVGQFRFTGNGCDIHGPFFGPDGYLYWTDGRHGYDIACREGHVLKGFAARIFRCRIDGSRIERIAGGGFDNPVELVFTPEGSIIGTMDQGSGDRLLHYVEGGVYPAIDHPSVEELVRTGPPLGSVSEFSAALPVALCGMERLRTTHFGEKFPGILLTAQFNVHRIQQHILTRDGATFRGTDEDFLLTFDHNVHPSDVLEDADGSLLMVDMGAWFNYGCPTSKIAKPEIKGSIYRIRRRDVAKIADPWGNSVKWSEWTPAELIELLDDQRIRVRDKVIDRLVKRGASATGALIDTLRDDQRALAARRGALWALARIEQPEARRAVCAALTCPEPSLRQVALHSVALERDAEALTSLTSIVVSNEPPERLKAAEALGRIGSPTAVPALLESLRQGVTDRFLEHALIFALIRIDDRSSTLAALTDPNPNVRRAGLIALDQMPSGKLTRDLVVPLLNTDDPQLQKTAMEVISRREGWAGEIVGLVREWMANPRLTDDQARWFSGALIAFGTDTDIHKSVADAMVDSKTSDQMRLLLLEVMARSRMDELPASWRDSLSRVLAESNNRLRHEAVATVRSRNLSAFDKQLADLSRNEKLPAALRIAALECVAPRRTALPTESFTLLTNHLKPEVEPLLRASSARALGSGRLDDQQLIQLARPLSDAGSLIVPQLLPAYATSGSTQVGLALVASLKQSPGFDALTPDQMNNLLSHYPPDVHSAAKPLLERLIARREQQAAYLAKVKLRLLRNKGDQDRGRRVFFSKKAACAGCHRLGEEGGSVGPDLSLIGRLRSPVDLVEAVIFPSSGITLGYEPYTIATGDGHVHTGIIIRETSDAVYLRTSQLAEIRIARGEVVELRRSHVSIMPEGLEKSLSSEELSDLLEFLYTRR